MMTVYPIIVKIAVKFLLNAIHIKIVHNALLATIYKINHAILAKNHA